PPLSRPIWQRGIRLKSLYSVPRNIFPVHWLPCWIWERAAARSIMVLISKAFLPKKIRDRSERKRKNQKLYHANGCCQTGHHHSRNEEDCRQGIPHRGGDPGSGGKRAGCDLCQQTAYLYRSQRRRLYAPHKN